MTDANDPGEGAGGLVERAGQGAFDYTLHGGAAATRVSWHFRTSSRLPVAVQSWELPPGGSEGVHRHPLDDVPLEELYLVVAGSVAMRVGEAEHRLGPGDTVLAPPGVDHDLRNTGPTPARVVVVWGAPGTPVSWTRFGTGRAAAAASGAAGTSGRPGDRQASAEPGERPSAEY